MIEVGGGLRLTKKLMSLLVLLAQWILQWAALSVVQIDLMKEIARGLFANKVIVFGATAHFQVIQNGHSYVLCVQPI